MENAGRFDSLFQGLWRHADFTRVWSAHTVSQFGSQITLLALPLTAAAILRATPSQMGILTAMGTLPILLIGLPAGAWVDRWPKRRILVIADLLRLCLLLVIPALTLIGALRIEALFIVSFLVGAATLFFDLAAQAYLPALIGREHLIDGNARLEMSRSAATVAGPSVAGILFQLLSAPLSITIDALSYLLSALFLARIEQSEPVTRQTQGNLWAQLREGISTLWHNEILRTIFRTVILWNFFVSIVQANFILFATRDLMASPTQLGLLFSMLGVGMLSGAAVVGPLRKRVGIGPLFIGSGFLAASSGLLVVLAGTIGRGEGFPVLLLSQFIYGLGPMIFSINDVTLRQSVTSNRMQARVTATYRFGILATAPFGALFGGFLGERFGLTAAIGLGACGMIVAVSLLLFSSLRTLREPPLPLDESVAV